MKIPILPLAAIFIASAAAYATVDQRWVAINNQQPTSTTAVTAAFGPDNPYDDPNYPSAGSAGDCVLQADRSLAALKEDPDVKQALASYGTGGYVIKYDASYEKTTSGYFNPTYKYKTNATLVFGGYYNGNRIDWSGVDLPSSASFSSSRPVVPDQAWKDLINKGSCTISKDFLLRALAKVTQVRSVQGLPDPPLSAEEMSHMEDSRQ